MCNICFNKLFSSNVYNKVEVRILENYLNQLTSRELKTAIFLDSIYLYDTDLIENLVEKDLEHVALPKKFDLNIQNLLPTNAFDQRTKFLSNETNQLKLI